MLLAAFKYSLPRRVFRSVQADELSYDDDFKRMQRSCSSTTITARRVAGNVS